MTIVRVGTGTGKVGPALDGAANPCLVAGLPATSAGEAVFLPITFNGATVNITAAQGQNGAGTNLGGTWSVIQGALSAGNNRSIIVYCRNAPAGVTQIQLTGSAGTPFGVGAADRFTHNGTLDLDTGSTPAGGFIGNVSGAVSTTVPIDSGNLTPTSANSLLIFAYGSDDSASGTVTIGGSGTYTSTFNEGDTTTHHAGAGGFQLVSSGTFNVTGLYNQENARGAILLAAFKESGAAATLTLMGQVCC